MSNPGDVTVIATMSIQNSANAAIIRAAEASGGFSTVADHTTRDALPTAVTTLGTLVRTLNDGVVWEVISVGPVVYAPWAGATGSTVLSNVLFVDNGYTGVLSNGAIATPLKTVASAITAATSGTLIILSPATYAESPVIPFSKTLRFGTLEFAGSPGCSISGQLSWTFKNGDELDMSGINLPSGISLKDGDAGTGAVLLRISNASFGAIVNGNGGAAPYTHVIGLTVAGMALTDTVVTTATGAINVSGEVQGNHARFLGNITCDDVIGEYLAFGDGITITAGDDSVLYDSEFGVGCTWAWTSSNRILNCDDSTLYFLQNVTITGTNHRFEVYRAGNRLSHTFHVDGGFSGTLTNGSTDNPYKTIVAALTAAVAAGVTDAVFMIQPGTYSGALVIAGAVRYKFVEVGFAGIPLVNVTGQVTWTMTDGAEISWDGCVVRTGGGAGPIFKDDIAAGTGVVHWNVRGGWMGVQTNGNTAAAAYSHDVKLRALYHIVNGESSVTTTQPTIDGFDTIGAGAGTGQVQITNTFLGGPGPYRCGFIRMRYASMAASSTLTTNGAGSTFEHGSSLGSASVLNNLGAAGVISLDVYSMYFWAANRNTQTGSANTLVPLSIDHTAELNASSGAGSAFSLDLVVNTRQKLTLNSGSCALSVTALRYPIQASCDIELRVVQDATGGRYLTYSSDFVGPPPPLNTAANAETLIPIRWNSTTQKLYFLGGGSVRALASIDSTPSDVVALTTLVKNPPRAAYSVKSHATIKVGGTLGKFAVFVTYTDDSGTSQHEQVTGPIDIVNVGTLSSGQINLATNGSGDIQYSVEALPGTFTKGSLSYGLRVWSMLETS